MTLTSSEPFLVPSGTVGCSSTYSSTMVSTLSRSWFGGSGCHALWWMHAWMEMHEWRLKYACMRACMPACMCNSDMLSDLNAWHMLSPWLTAGALGTARGNTTLESLLPSCFKPFVPSCGGDSSLSEIFMASNLLASKSSSSLSSFSSSNFAACADSSSSNFNCFASLSVLSKSLGGVPWNTLDQ